jgi:hypothetical protein
MKILWRITAISFIVTLFSFQEKSSVNYWKALKGIANISYKDNGVYVGNISKNPWNVPEFRDNKSEDKRLLDEENILLENNFVVRVINGKRKRRCKYPKSARKLNGKRILLSGWITHLPSNAYILTEHKFDPDNWMEWPGSDERIELDRCFSKYLDTEVLLEGQLKLNKHDNSRAFYILEEIEALDL